MSVALGFPRVLCAYSRVTELAERAAGVHRSDGGVGGEQLLCMRALPRTGRYIALLTTRRLCLYSGAQHRACTPEKKRLPVSPKRLRKAFSCPGISGATGPLHRIRRHRSACAAAREFRHANPVRHQKDLAELLRRPRETPAALEIRAHDDLRNHRQRAQMGGTPVFADVDPVTYNIDPDKLRRVQEWIKGKGSWMGFFVFLPGVGDFIAVALGFLRANIWIVAVSMFLGKAIRYWVWMEFVYKVKDLI